jgi:hypothetical protein
MTNTLDIFRAAKLLIDHHGDDSALDAAGLTDLLPEERDTLFFQARSASRSI